MKLLFIPLLFLQFFISCSTDAKMDKDSLPTSSGKYGEVLVVIDTLYEGQKSGQAIYEVFNQEVLGLPQRETMFRMSTVSPNAFKSILKRARNILKVSIRAGSSSQIKQEEDVWAKEQLLINVIASNDVKAAAVLLENKDAIRNFFNAKEIQRLIAQFSIDPNKKLQKIIENRFHLSSLIPPAYVMMDSSGNGLWLKKEKQIGQHSVMQGLMIYQTPYLSDTTFSSFNMTSSRNSFTSSHVQGTRDSSYMQVYDEFLPITEEVNLNGLYAMKYKGLWNMKNDFMGGPFIHYTFVDESRQKVIHIDGFVYAPKFNKREYVRELQAIIESFDLNEM